MGFNSAFKGLNQSTTFPVHTISTRGEKNKPNSSDPYSKAITIEALHLISWIKSANNVIPYDIFLTFVHIYDPFCQEVFSRPSTCMPRSQHPTAVRHSSLAQSSCYNGPGFDFTHQHSSKEHTHTHTYIYIWHCDTNRKVTGSIPGGVIRFFHWHNPSGRTMALGLTQPLTEMSTRNISWG